MNSLLLHRTVYLPSVTCYTQLLLIVILRKLEMPICQFIVSIIHSYIIIYAVELSCISVQVFTHNL